MNLLKMVAVYSCSTVIMLGIFFYVLGTFPGGIGRVTTGSMEPTLMIGDWVNTDQGVPKIGDIIEFDCITDNCKQKQGVGRHIVHRLTAIDDSGCMTIIGDNPDYDWTTLSCYMPDQIEIVGIVHKL